MREFKYKQVNEVKKEVIKILIKECKYISW